ncbi:MAG: F0F1 ATP synthase subunit delta [Prevotellaceae bacterium]|nr:F0F1 ATP synthase subunit delta [Prevotellaceae bacterium]
MNTGVISVRYARALLKSANAQGAKDEVYADMQTLAQSYLTVRQLRSAIDNPMLPKEDKQMLLKSACGGNPCKQTITFIDVVLKEGRENLIQFMANSYVTLYREEKNIISGRLITAVAVSDETEAKMRQMVEKRTNATVEFQTEVNPDIIGGFILEYDTYRMDASVQSQLRTILKELN